MKFVIKSLCSLRCIFSATFAVKNKWGNKMGKKMFLGPIYSDYQIVEWVTVLPEVKSKNISLLDAKKGKKVLPQKFVKKQ